MASKLLYHKVLKHLTYLFETKAAHSMNSEHLVLRRRIYILYIHIIHIHTYTPREWEGEGERKREIREHRERNNVYHASQEILRGEINATPDSFCTIRVIIYTYIYDSVSPYALSYTGRVEETYTDEEVRKSGRTMSFVLN